MVSHLPDVDLLIIYASGPMLDVLVAEDRQCYNMSASFSGMASGKRAELQLEQSLIWLEMNQWQIHFAAPDMDVANTSAVPAGGRYSNKSSATYWLEAAVKHYQSDTSIRWNEESLQALVQNQRDEAKKIEMEDVVSKLQGKLMSQTDLISELHRETMSSDPDKVPCEIVADFPSSCFAGLTPARKNKGMTTGVVVTYALNHGKKAGSPTNATLLGSDGEAPAMLKSPSMNSSHSLRPTSSLRPGSKHGTLPAIGPPGLPRSPSGAASFPGLLGVSSMHVGESPKGAHSLIGLTRMMSEHGEDFRLRRIYMKM
eukprot:TRINITY_DN27539_c0_g1_i1.p1 TRINITY_DN27539_c0_g1~~TRINITY_DN27539_c0_g1_i1.p1  ORF type:complete len:313 (-),score=55.51 TRINITY_DN27539_c0_g1_i1:160-1098(-)